jgi:transcriptional regulator with XRE-family HTH domain
MLARVESNPGGLMRGAFDHEGFYSDLDATRQARRLNWKQVAAEASVSPSTLTRLGQGKRPDVDSLAALSRWAGFDADDYMRGQAAPGEAEPLAQIVTYLRSDRNLSEQSAKMLEQLVRSTYDTLREDAPAEG